MPTLNLIMQGVGYITAVGAAVAYIARLCGWLKKTEERQNVAIRELTMRVEKLEAKTSADYIAIEDIKAASQLQTAALLALSKHALNGNDIDALQDATRNLEQYLINRR